MLEFAYRELDSELVRQRLEAARRPQTDGDEALRAVEFDRSMQLLREHQRGRKGALEPLPGAAPRHASLDEVCLALARRLKKFPPTLPGQGAGGGPGEAPEGPDPGSEEDPSPPSS